VPPLPGVPSSCVWAWGLGFAVRPDVWCPPRPAASLAHRERTGASLTLQFMVFPAQTPSLPALIRPIRDFCGAEGGCFLLSTNSVQWAIRHNLNAPMREPL